MGLYDYGVRYYDPAIARFSSIDRFAEKFPSQSPYHYAANNPIQFIDVNGDSIDVGDVRSKSPDDRETTQQELGDFTGLNLSVDDSGNMTYTKPEGKLSGSKRVRKMLMKAI